VIDSEHLHEPMDLVEDGSDEVNEELNEQRYPIEYPPVDARVMRAVCVLKFLFFFFISQNPFAAIS